MNELVERVKTERWKNAAGEMVTSYKVTLVNEMGQREVPCYDARGGQLQEDALLPDGWEVKTSQKGKLYLAAPKPLGSEGKRGFTPRPAAWANTEEGEKYVQERMDRRTALMQAVAMLPEMPKYWESRAEEFYSWLRKNLDGGGVEPGEASSPSSTKRTHSQKWTPNEPPKGWQ